MPVSSLEDLIQAVIDQSPSGSELDRVQVAVAMAAEMADLSDALTNHFVEAARNAGATWTQVGDALGMSKQGAQQWVRRKIKEAAAPAMAFRDLMKKPFLARFTARARVCVKNAGEEAGRLDHPYVGTEHLLLSILSQSANVARRALDRLGIDLDDLHTAAAELALTAGEAAAGLSSEAPRQGRPFTPRAQRVLEKSLREALRLGHSYIGTEHILIALVDERDGLAGKAMASAGIEIEALRQAVLDELAA